MAYSALVIDGSSVSVPNANRIRPVRLSLGYDRVPELELVQGPGAALPPSLTPGDTVVLTVDTSGTPKVAFRGRVEGVYPTRGNTGWAFGYRCMGLEHYADRIPIKNPNLGKHGYRFNMGTDDPDYSPSLTGRTVGQQIQEILTDHATALTALGINTSTYTADFNALDWVPPRPTDISGDRLLNTLSAFIAQWAPNHRLHVTHASDTVSYLRLFSAADPGGTITLTVGEDLVEPPVLTYDLSQCAGRVEILGGPEIEPWEFRLTAAHNPNKLSEDWTGGQETAWTIADYEGLSQARFKGTVTSMNSTSATIDPTDNTLALTANELTGTRRGTVRLSGIDLAGSGYEWKSQQTRVITSHTALTAGGTFTVTVDPPFSLTTFTAAEVYTTKSDAFRSHVHRRFKPTDTVIRARLQREFPRNEPFKFGAGDGLLLTKAPMAYIEKSGVQYFAPIEIDTNLGTITFQEPIVAMAGLNTRAQLVTGGGSLNQPDDVMVFAPVAGEQLSAVYPPDSGGPVYTGNAYTTFGLEQTETILMPEWKDAGHKAEIMKLAEEIHATHKDVIVSGNLTLYGYRLHEFLDLNSKVSFAWKTCPGGTTLSTGWYGAQSIPIRSLTAVWGAQQGMVISLEVSNQRQVGVGADLYTHGADTVLTNNPFAIEGLPEQGMALGGPGNMPSTFMPVGDLTGMAGQTVATMRGLGASNNVDAFSRSIGQGMAGYDIGALSRQMGSGQFNAPGAMNQRYGTPMPRPPAPQPAPGAATPATQPDPMRDILGGM